MARKFFNKKVKVNDSHKTLIQIIIIVASLIGIIICFVVANYFLNKSKENKDAIIKLRDSVSVEVNTNLPDKTLFFSELEKVDEDDIKVSFDDADITKVGSYDVTVKIYKKKYKVTLQVVDTISPELTLKNLEIGENQTYSVNDFVENCSDNSKVACSLNYFTDNDIDYANYTTPGVYKIQIVASDSANNTTVQETTLTINGNGGQVTPTSCTYGNSEYDKDAYILAIDITENGCARDLNLYQNEVILEGVNKIMQQDNERVKKEIDKLNLDIDGASIVRNPVAVLNTSGKGLVGYTIHMDVAINKGDTSEIVESYYIDLSGKRIYSINKYNLP